MLRDALTDRDIPTDRRLLAPGTVGIISGPGGIGKSTLAQMIACAAAAGNPTGAGLAAIGLAAAPGSRPGLAGRPVSMWCLEDPAALAARRTAATADWWASTGGPHLDNYRSRIAIYGAEDTGPLWEAPDYRHRDKEHGPTNLMLTLAADLLERRPILTIIDPALCALAAPAADAHTVRSFIATLSRMTGEIDGAALIVAHSTKAARDGLSEAGAISGSAAWHDAARLVITATPPPKPKGSTEQPEGVHLTVTKANLGKTGPLTNTTTNLPTPTTPLTLTITPHNGWPAALTPTNTTTSNHPDPYAARLEDL